MLEHSSITTGWAALETSPLSRKKAMLLALLIDAEIDRRAGDDPLAYRASVSDAALKVVLDLAAMPEAGPRLVLEPVSVTAAVAKTLREADYMVSLYNAGMVQRVRVAWVDGRREDALTLLREAVDALERSRD